MNAPRSSSHLFFSLLILIVLSLSELPAQSSPSSPPYLSKRDGGKPSSIESGIDPGIVNSGVYRNKALAVSCRIPDGWVLRTDEMNVRNEDESAFRASKDAKVEAGRVLLAAFSRPPQAHAEDVNSSILIAAESAASYPGIKDAAQYFSPLTEVTKARGFTEVGEPYEFAIGTKSLARDDFQKDVGTRVMRQATLVMLARGYVVSFTFIGGTEDEVEELVGGLNFAASAKPAK